MTDNQTGFGKALKVGSEVVSSLLKGKAKKVAPPATTITSDQAKALEIIQLKNNAFRDAFSLSKDSDHYASQWQENLNDANVVYGAFAALHRLSTGKVNPARADALERQLNDINPGTENNLGLIYADQVQDVVKRIIETEKSGKADFSKITAQDIQFLQLAAYTLEADIENAVYDQKTAAQAFVDTPRGLFEKAASSGLMKTRMMSFAADKMTAIATQAMTERVAIATATFDRATLALHQHMEVAGAFIRPFATDLAKSLNSNFKFDAIAADFDPNTLSHAPVVEAFKLPFGDSLREFGAIGPDTDDFLGDVQALSSVISTLHSRGGRKAKAIKQKLGTKNGKLDIDALSMEFKLKDDSDASRQSVVEEIKNFALTNGARARDLDPKREGSLFSIARKANSERIGTAEIEAANITGLIKDYAMMHIAFPQRGKITQSQLTMQRVAHGVDRLNEILNLTPSDAQELNSVLLHAQNIRNTMTSRSRPGDTVKAVDAAGRLNMAESYFADEKETQVAQTAMGSLTSILENTNTPEPRTLTKNEMGVLFDDVQHLLQASSEAAAKYEHNGYPGLAEHARDMQDQLLEIIQPHSPEAVPKLELFVEAIDRQIAAKIAADLSKPAPSGGGGGG
ncbi:MAG: hypothetical protein AB8B83_05760 [Bdellovibrionales bacterium]